MNQEAILWLFGVTISIQLAVVSALVSAMWSHVQACKETATLLATLNANVVRIMVDIGDHESGLRGAVHEHAQRLTEHEMRLEVLDRGRE